MDRPQNSNSAQANDELEDRSAEFHVDVEVEVPVARQELDGALFMERQPHMPAGFTRIYKDPVSTTVPPNLHFV